MKIDKLWSFIAMLAFILVSTVSFTSCSGSDDDNDNKLTQDQNNNNGTSGNSSSQDELSLRMDINDKVNVSASYEIGIGYDHNIQYNLSTALVPKAGMVIKYGVEYGLDGYDYYNLFEVNEGSSSMRFCIIIPKEGEAETLFAEYQTLIGSLRALNSKFFTGWVLTDSEKELMSELKQKCTVIETYMKKHFIARAYVSINETKYYFHTVKFDYNGNLKQEKVNCYKE